MKHNSDVNFLRIVLFLCAGGKCAGAVTSMVIVENCDIISR